MKVTYDQIESNIADLDVNGNWVDVTWKCPVSGKVVANSQAQMQSEQKVSRDVTNAVKRSVFVQLLGFTTDIIGAVFGSRAGVVAKAAANPLSAGVHGKIAAPVYSEASRRAAVVAAFAKVQPNFRWDEDREIYVAAPTPD